MIVFLDACTIIYWMEGAAPWFERLDHRLRELRATYDDPPVAVSALSRLECRAKPMRDKDITLLNRYDRFFAQPQLLVVPISDRVLETATRLRADPGLAAPDAIQAASALSLADECKFVTNDNGIKAVPGLEIVRF